jgi:hypothetical protein
MSQSRRWSDLESDQRDAKRYRWLVENPGLAILAFAEATNVDTFGIPWNDGKPCREVTSEEYNRYLHERIDQFMAEQKP